MYAEIFSNNFCPKIIVETVIFPFWHVWQTQIPLTVEAYFFWWHFRRLVSFLRPSIPWPIDWAQWLLTLITWWWRWDCLCDLHFDNSFQLFCGLIRKDNEDTLVPSILQILPTMSQGANPHGYFAWCKINSATFFFLSLLSKTNIWAIKYNWLIKLPTDSIKLLLEMLLNREIKEWLVGDFLTGRLGKMKSQFVNSF